MIRIWMLTWPVTPQDPKKRKSIEKTPLVKADSVESYESVEVPVSDDRIHPISSGRRSEDQTSLLIPTDKNTAAPNTHKENGYLVANGRESTLPLQAGDSREDKIVPDSKPTLNANPPDPHKVGGEDRQRNLHPSRDKGLEKSPGSESRHDGLPPTKQTLFQMASNRRHSGQNDDTDERQRTLPSSPDSKLGNHGNGYQAGDETSLLIGPGNSRTPGGKDDRGHNSGSDVPHRYGAIPGETNGNSHSDSGDSPATCPNSDSSVTNGTEDRERHMSPSGHPDDERDKDGSLPGDKASLLIPPSGQTRRGSNDAKDGDKLLKSSESRDKALPSNQNRGRRLEASPGRASKSRSPSLNAKRPNDKEKQPVKEIQLRKEKPPVPTVRKMGFGSAFKQPKPESKDSTKDPKKRKAASSKTPKHASDVIEPQMVQDVKTQKPVSAVPPGGKGKKPGARQGGASNSEPGQDKSPGAQEAVTPDDGDFDAETPLTFVAPDGSSPTDAARPQAGYLVLYNDIEDSDDNDFVESSTDLQTSSRRPRHLDLQFDAGEASDDPHDDYGPGHDRREAPHRKLRGVGTATDASPAEISESTPVAVKMAAPRGAAGTAITDDPRAQAPRGGVGGAPPGKDAARSQRELQGSRPATVSTGGGDADNIDMNDPHGQPLRRPVVDEDSLVGEGGRRTKGSPGTLNVRRAAGDDGVIVPEDAHVSHAQLQARGADTGGGEGLRNGKDGAPPGKDAARSQRELQGSGPATVSTGGGDANNIDMNDPHGQPLRRPVVDENSLVGEGGRRTKGSPGSLNVRRAAGDDGVIVPEDAHVSHAQLQARGADTGGGEGLRNGKDGAPPGKDAARSQRELQGSGPATVSTGGGDANNIDMNDPHGQPLCRPVVDEDSLVGEGGRRTKGSPGSLNVRRAAGDDGVIVPEDAHVSHAQLQARGADTGGGEGLRNGKDGAPPGKDAARSQREQQGSGPATVSTGGGDANNIDMNDPHGQPLRRPVVDEDSLVGEGGRRTKGSPGSLNVSRAAGDDGVIVPEDAHVSHAQLQARGADTGGGEGLRNGKDGAPPGKDAARSQRELQGSRPATVSTGGGDANNIDMNDPHGQPLRRPVVDEDSLVGEGGRRTKGSPGSLNVSRAAGDDGVIVPEDAHVSHAQLQARGADTGGGEGLRNGKDGAPPGKDAARSQRELQGSRPATVSTGGGDANNINMNDPHGQPLRRPVVDEDSLVGEGGRRTKGSPGSLNVRRAAGDDGVIVPEDAHVSYAQLQARGADTGGGEGLRNGKDGAPPGKDAARSQRELQGSRPATVSAGGGDADNIDMNDPHGQPLRRPVVDEDSLVGEGGRRTTPRGGVGRAPPGKDAARSQRELQGSRPATVSTGGGDADNNDMNDPHEQPLRRPVVDEDSLVGEGGSRTKGSPGSLNVRRAAGDDGVIVPEDAHVSHAQLQARGADTSGGEGLRNGKDGAPPGKDAARSQREVQGSRPATVSTVGGDANNIDMNDPHGQPLRRPVVDEDSLVGEGGSRTKGSPGSLNVRRAAGDDGVIVPEDAHVSHAQLQAKGVGGRDGDAGNSPTSLDVRRAPGDEDVIVPEDASVSRSQLRPSGGSGDDGGRGRNIAVLSGQGKLPDGQDTPSSQREMDDPGFSTHIMSSARPSDRDGMTGGQHGASLRRPGEGVSPAPDPAHSGGAPPGKDAARSQRELQGSRPATVSTGGGDADNIDMNDPHGQPLRRPVVDEDSLVGEGGRRTKGSPGSLNVRRDAGDGDVIVPEDAHVSHAQLQATGAGRRHHDGDSPASLDVRRARGDEDVIVPEDASVSRSQLRPSGGSGDDGGRGRNIAVLSGHGKLPDGQDTPSSQREMDDPGFSTHIMSSARPSDRDGMTGGQHGASLRRPGDGGSPAPDPAHSGGGLHDAPDRGRVITDKGQTTQKPAVNVVLIEKGPMTPGERRHAEALKMNSFIDRVHIELPSPKMRIIVFVRPGCWSLPYNDTPGTPASGTPASGTPARTQQKKQNVSFGDTPDQTTTKSKSVDDGEVSRKRKTFARVSRKGSRRLSRLRSFKRSSSLEDVEHLEPVMPDLAPVEAVDKRKTTMKKTRSLDALDDDQPIWLDRHKSIDLSEIEARRDYTRDLEIIQGDSVRQLVKGFEDYSRRVSRDWTALPS